MGDIPGLEKTVISLADRIELLRLTGKRILVAIAGPPGAGKSTLAVALTGELQRRGKKALLLPMDGFHLDNMLLEASGMLARKGAPETFDFPGFLAAVQRVCTQDTVILPEFDRAQDTVIAGSLEVRPETEIIVVEGNYLCLDEAPWSELKQYWSLTVFLDVPIPELKQRLVARWRRYGLDPMAAKARAENNDIPNAQRVNRAICPVDEIVR